MNKTIHQVGESPRPLFRGQALKEGAARFVFTLTACISILAVILICVFLFANGIPGMVHIGVWDFLSGQKWKPGNEIFGILPFILGSIYVTAGALIVGVPAGLMTAIFMSRFASKKIVRVMRPAVSLLAGIPSVVYGFFGLVVLAFGARTLWRYGFVSPDGMRAAGDDDSADDHYRVGICAECGSCELL